MFKIAGKSVVVITTAQLYSTKPELRFCTGSNPARGVSGIRDGEDLWQWSRLEIRLNVFRRSTIPQKQFIIIIIIIIIICGSVFKNVRLRPVAKICYFVSLSLSVKSFKSWKLTCVRSLVQLDIFCHLQLIKLPWV